jgi:hypothetical protein
MAKASPNQEEEANLREAEMRAEEIEAVLRKFDLRPAK